MDIRRYTREDLIHEAGRKREQLEGGELNRLEFSIAMQDFVLRDLEGSYWFVDARSDGWYRYADGLWETVSHSDVPKHFEALDLIPAFSSQPPEAIEARVTALFEDGHPPGGEAPAALAALLAKTHRAFDEGLLSSDEAAELMAMQYLIDDSGSIWTVGLRTGGWFRFQEAGWQSAAAPPASDTLLRLRPEAERCERCGADLDSRPLCRECGHWMPPSLENTGEAADAGLLAFLMYGMGTLPEELAEAWDPPEGLPDDESSVGPACSACGAHNPVGSRFCNQCATPLGCPHCGGSYPPGSRFCNRCGAELAPA